jgi:hypothetical protein
VRTAAALLALILTSTGVSALDESRNTLYVEFLGNAVFYSLNYDRVFFKLGESNRIGCRIGLSFLPITKDTVGGRYPLLFPVTVNYLLGKGENKLEVGAGATPRVFLADDGSGGEQWEGLVSFTGTIAYRYQSIASDFNFRAGCSLVVLRERYRPWVSLSFGRSF